MTDLTLDLKKVPGPILIIGAQGFIGKYFFSELSKHRDDVYGLVRSRKDPDRVQKISVEPTLRGQLDFILKPKIFSQDTTWATIFDLATDSYKTDDPSYIANGPLRVKEILESLPNSTQYFYYGTSLEYGDDCNPGRVNQNPSPKTPYALNKTLCQNLISFYGSVHRKPCAHIRLFSVYGPGENENRLIPALLRNARENKFPRLSSKTNAHDFIYVQDVLEFSIRIASQLRLPHYGQIYNVGSGINTSLESIALLIKKTFKVTADPEFDTCPNNPWDKDHWVADISETRTQFNWEPRFSLEKGLLLTSEALPSQIHKPREGTNRTPSVSVVIACYQEEKNIPEMYARLSKTFLDFELDGEFIFVNDGSKDSSEKTLNSLAMTDERILAIHHSRNFGSQAAFISGIQNAHGDAIILMDGDLQDPPELIPKLVEAYVGEPSIVGAKRVKRQMCYLRGLGHKLFYRIWKYFSDSPVDLDVGDFCIMNKTIAKSMIEMKGHPLFLRGARSFLVPIKKYIDYERPDRRHGFTTNDLFKNWEWLKIAIFQFSSKIHKGFLNLSLILFFTITASLPFTSLSGAEKMTLEILSLALMGIGLILESLWHIQKETMNLPHAFIKSLVRKNPRSISQR